MGAGQNRDRANLSNESRVSLIGSALTFPKVVSGPVSISLSGVSFFDCAFCVETPLTLPCAFAVTRVGVHHHHHHHHHHHQSRDSATILAKPSFIQQETAKKGRGMFWSLKLEARSS